MKTIKLFLATLLASGLSFESKSQVYTSDDISAQFLISAIHDSTICATYGDLMYQVTIENSYLNDTCKLKDMSGQLLYQEINSSGQTPWTITMPVFGNTVSDQYLMGGNIATFQYFPTKITTLHDTLSDINNFFDFPVDDPCSYGTIDGRVYVDMNSDCAYNTGDLDLNSIIIQAVSSLSSPATPTLYASAGSNIDGTYQAMVQESWMNSVTVSVPSYLSFIFPPTPCSPGSYTFMTVPQSNVDFSLQCTGNVDVQTSIGSNGVVRPNIPFFLHPYVSNTGCDAASGILKLVLDADVVYNASLSSNPATSVNGDTLYWNYTNLTNISSGAYWNSFFAGVHLTPTLAVNIGDTLCFKVITNIPSGDIEPMNNVAEICLPVVNSYDPNMKEVSPKGEGVAGFIEQTTEKLTYTIHFQNTGNAVAYNISVLDTLSGNLVPSSVKILGSSHTMTPEWVSASVLRFNFYSIMLADSNSNEPASHGFVTFEVEIANGMMPGETIENTAHIFFDFNQAIVTNTALNTIAEELSTEELSGITVNIHPNPASCKISILAEDLLSVRIIDFSGKVIVENAMLKDQSLDVSGLKNGMYILQISTSKGTASKKLLIQK